MRMKFIGAVSAAALSAAVGGAAFANTMNINQAPQDPIANPDAGIGTGVFSQSVAGNNAMDVTVQGSVDIIVIQQEGLDNVLAMSAYGLDTTAGQYAIFIDGDSNTNTLAIGAPGQANRRFADPVYQLQVDGNVNAVTDTIVGGGDLQYIGFIEGDANTVNISGGPVGGAGGAGAGSFDIFYTIEGTGNILGVAGGLFDSNRNLEVEIVGNNNSLAYASLVSAGTTTTAVITLDGDDIDSSVAQTGAGGVVDATVLKTGAGVFEHAVAQSGANAVALMTINAAGAGDFGLTQETAGASFTGVMTIADGGSVTAAQ